MNIVKNSEKKIPEWKTEKGKAIRRKASLKYYYENKEKLKKKHKDYYDVVKNTKNNTLEKRASFKHHQLKSTAKKRKIPFLVERHWFENWFKIKAVGNCCYCGVKLIWEKGGNTNFKASVDRINNSVGYESGNVVVCCNRCNAIKGKWFDYKQMKQIGEILKGDKTGKKTH